VAGEVDELGAGDVGVDATPADRAEDPAGPVGAAEPHRHPGPVAVRSDGSTLVATGLVGEGSGGGSDDPCRVKG
jgi:hypothetical protein